MHLQMCEKDMFHICTKKTLFIEPSKRWAKDWRAKKPAVLAGQIAQSRAQTLSGGHHCRTHTDISNEHYFENTHTNTNKNTNENTILRLNLIGWTPLPHTWISVTSLTLKLLACFRHTWCWGISWCNVVSTLPLRNFLWNHTEECNLKQRSVGWVFCAMTALKLKQPLRPDSIPCLHSIPRLTHFVGHIGSHIFLGSINCTSFVILNAKFSSEYEHNCGVTPWCV